MQHASARQDRLLNGAFIPATSPSFQPIRRCQVPNGSPIEHHPTMNGIWSIMATIRWCPIFPKWDSYQPLTNCRSLLVTRSLCHSACLSAGCHAPCVIPTYSNCSSLRDDPINWELASKTILQNPTSLSMQSHAVPIRFGFWSPCGSLALSIVLCMLRLTLTPSSLVSQGHLVSFELEIMFCLVSNVQLGPRNRLSYDNDY